MEKNANLFNEMKEAKSDTSKKRKLQTKSEPCGKIQKKMHFNRKSKQASILNSSTCSLPKMKWSLKKLCIDTTGKEENSFETEQETFSANPMTSVKSANLGIQSTPFIEHQYNYYVGCKTRCKVVLSILPEEKWIDVPKPLSDKHFLPIDAPKNADSAEEIFTSRGITKNTVFEKCKKLMLCYVEKKSHLNIFNEERYVWVSDSPLICFHSEKHKNGQGYSTYFDGLKYGVFSGHNESFHYLHFSRQMDLMDFHFIEHKKAK